MKEVKQMPSREEILGCVADELMFDAVHHKQELYKGTLERARCYAEEFGYFLKYEDFLYIAEIIKERNFDIITDYFQRGTNFTIKINHQFLDTDCPYFNEDKKEFKKYCRHRKKFNEYSKNYDNQYNGKTVVANGEYYDVLTEKQAQFIVNKFINWTIGY